MFIKNIAYKNATCEAVATTVRKKIKTSDYEVGEILVCRKRYAGKKKLTMHVNYEYMIKEIHGSELTLQVCGNDKTFKVDINTVKTHCTYDYCRTCHSFQGASIDQEMCIFDCDFHYVNRFWLWTAIARTKQLNNVFFYERC